MTPNDTSYLNGSAQFSSAMARGGPFETKITDGG
jgi:hypothetical protein